MKISMVRKIAILLILSMSFYCFAQNLEDKDEDSNGIVIVVVLVSVSVVSALISRIRHSVKIKKAEEERIRVEEERAQQRELEKRRLEQERIRREEAAARRIELENRRLEQERIKREEAEAEKNRRDSLAVVKLVQEINEIPATYHINELLQFKSEFDQKIDAFRSEFDQQAIDAFIQQSRTHEIKMHLDSLLYKSLFNGVSIFLEKNRIYISEYFSESREEIALNNNIKSLNSNLSEYISARGEVVEYRDKTLQLYGTASDSYTNRDVIIVVQDVEESDMNFAAASGDFLGIGTAFSEAFGGTKHRSVIGLKYIKRGVGINAVGGSVPIYYYQVDPNARRLINQIAALRNQITAIKNNKYETLRSRLVGYTLSTDDQNLRTLKRDLHTLGVSATVLKKYGF